MDAVLQSRILNTLGSVRYEWLRPIKIRYLSGMDVPKSKIKDELDEMSTMGLIDTKVQDSIAGVLYRIHLDPYRPVNKEDILEFLRSRITHRPSIAKMAFELGYDLSSLSVVIDNLVQDGVLERSLYLGEQVIGLPSATSYTPMSAEELENSILETIKLANNSWASVNSLRKLGKIREKPEVIRAKLIAMAQEKKIDVKMSAHNGFMFRVALDPNREMDVEKVLEFICKRARISPSLGYIAQELGYTETAIGLALEHLIERGDVVKRERDSTYASTKAIIDHPARRFKTKIASIAKKGSPEIAAPRTFSKTAEYKWVLPSYIAERLRTNFSFKGVFSDPDKIEEASDARE